MKQKRLALAVLAAACMASFSAMANTKGTLVVGKSTDPDTLDPAVTMTNDSFTVTYPAYERLMRFKSANGRGSTEVEGDLARSWTVSPDGKTYTFTLKSGKTFADGSPLDAKAVKFSFDRMLKIKKGPADIFKGVESVEAPDANTVRFVLKTPFAPFLRTLAINGAGIVNPKVMQFEKDGDLGQAYLAERSMGSGPYAVTSWEKGQQVVLERNPRWTEGKPQFDRFIVKIVKEASARRLQLEKGDLDIAEDVPIDQLERLKTHPQVRVVNEPSLSVTYLYLNNKSKPLADSKVRQAISYATDYSSIIKGVTANTATQMRGPVPAGMFGHDPSAFQFSYDPNKAKNLLDQAGGSRPEKVSFLYSKTDPAWEPIGLVLQQQLSQVGIKLEMQPFAQPVMRQKIDKGEFDIAIGNWTPDYGDVSEFMNAWFESDRFGLPGNRAFYSNPTVDQLVKSASANKDTDAKLKGYLAAQKIVIEDAPYVYLFQKNYRVAMRNDLQGYVYNPMTLQIFNVAQMSR